MTMSLRHPTGERQPVHSVYIMWWSRIRSQERETQSLPDQSGIYTRSLCTAQIYKAELSSAVVLVGLVLLPFMSFTFYIFFLMHLQRLWTW